MKTQTIREFESLRGYMALWVVIGHAISRFPEYFKGFPILGRLYDGGIAVSVFVILSGFVIFYLLDAKKEKYFIFLIRRGLRLFPIYLFVLLISIATHDSTFNLLLALVAKYPDVSSLINGVSIAVHAEKYYEQNIFSHIILMQGVVPDSIIPEGVYAFVGQAWSLSLEAQFYIVAPVCMYLILNKNVAVRLLLPIILMTLYFLFRDINEGFIFGPQLIYFIIGGGSYYLWKNIIQSTKSNQSFDVLFFAICLLVAKLSSLGLPELIWLTVFLTALYNYLDCQNGMTRFVSFFLLNRVSRFLGKISYSLYLNHMVIIYGLLKIIQEIDVDFFNIGESAILILIFMLVVLCLTIMMSAVTYKFIEKPFIELGKRCFTKNDQMNVVIEKG